MNFLEFAGSQVRSSLVTKVPFYGVKEDISTGTGRGQTVKDIFHLIGSAFDDRGEDNEDTAVKTALT